MPQISERPYEMRPLQVDCSCTDQVKAASFDLHNDGEMFECTVGRMTKQAVATLDDAIYAQTPVQLLFADSSLLLYVQSLESSEPYTVRIVGRVIAQPLPQSRLQ